jgi:signal transduction histidine kinase/ligand-binding sensor domain-containing protein
VGSAGERGARMTLGPGGRSSLPSPSRQAAARLPTALLAVLAIFGVLTLVSTIAAAPSAGQAATRPATPATRGEVGRPFLGCISSRDYGAASQNWVFAEDDRGLLYVGNNLGVLEYDGASWRLIETATKSVVRAITKDDHGRLFVGSTGEIGYLAPDASGQLQYVSLLPNVPPEDRAFNDVWTAHATPQGVYFQSREILLRVTAPTDAAATGGWRVRSWKPQGRFLFGFWVGGTYYVHQQGVGLQRMVGDQLQLVPGSEQFAGERLQVLLPLANGSATDLLLGTFNRGFFRYDGRTFQPFATEADAYFRERTLYKGVTLPDGTFALATISGGVVIIDAGGHALRYINQQTGLPNDNGLAAFVDHSGILWIAPEGAVCQAETPSPLSRFDIRVGLSGTVADVVRHKGVLYVATGVGVFYLDQATSTFKQVTGFRAGNSQATGLASNGDVLMVGYGSGLHQVDGAVAHLIKPNIGASFSCGALRFSRQDPRRLWVALEDGLASLRLDDAGHWVDEGRIPGVRETLSVLAEPEPGVLWLGTGAQGTLRVQFPGPSPEHPRIDRFGKAAGLAGDNGVAPYSVNGRPVFVMKQGVFRFDQNTQRFTPDTTFTGVSVGGTQDESAMAEDAQGNVWANFGRETGVFRRRSDGSYAVDKTALLRFSDLAVSRIYPEPGGVVWFGRDDGLIRYDPSVPKNYSADYSVLIRKVTAGDGHLLFGGARDGTGDPTLDASDNALRFEFAATSYEDVRATQYQSMLEGFDSHWSAWSPETKRDYTNLPSRPFRFRVHARNLYQHDSLEADYAFAIAPPWQSTWWAFTLYILAAGAAVFGFVATRTRHLRAESRRLERVIGERTQEIRDREAEVRTQAEELRTIDDIVKAINREEGLRNVLHALLEQGMKLVPQAQKAAFLIRDLATDSFVFASHTGYPDDQFTGVSLTETEVTHRYAEGTERVEKGVYIVRPLESNGRAPIAGLETPKAMVAMTVALHGRLEGLLVFDNLDDPNAFSHSDLQRLTRLREHALAAVAKARTLVTLQEKTAALQQQKEEVEQAYDNVELLSRIGRDITAKLSSAEIISTVYENVNSLMDAAVFGIGLYNEAEAQLDFPATKENGVQLAPFSYRLDDDSRLAVVCYQRRQEIVIEDMPREHSRYIATYRPPVAGQPVASLLYLPLLYKDRAIGVITAQSFRKHAYTDYHLNILRNLATYATIALENADAYRRLIATLDRLKATQEQLVVQEKLASLGALTAGIAHEIKNPLNFVNNFAELSVELAEELRQELELVEDRIAQPDFEQLRSLAADLRTNASKINEHGRRADSIVRGMLLHSRGQSGDRQETDVNALLEEYVNLSYHGMRAQDSSFNLTVERAYDPAVGTILAVPQDLSRVFLNIVNNACYATHQKKKALELQGQRDYAPTLSVSTEGASDWVEIRVRDNGDGIPQEVRDRIFNPFFTTKPTGQGTGLGLSISHDIVVQQHHGTLEVDSSPGQYTVFVIRLPRTDGAGVSDAGAAPA